MNFIVEAELNNKKAVINFNIANNPKLAVAQTSISRALMSLHLLVSVVAY